MEQIVSMIVANGLWAVLFCGLLVFELRDSRRREERYTQTIRSLSERLGVVNAVKDDTQEIRSDAKDILSDTKTLIAGTSGGKKHRKDGAGGGICAELA